PLHHRGGEPVPSGGPPAAAQAFPPLRGRGRRGRAPRPARRPPLHRDRVPQAALPFHCACTARAPAPRPGRYRRRPRRSDGHPGHGGATRGESGTHGTPPRPSPRAVVIPGSPRELRNPAMATAVEPPTAAATRPPG